MLSARWRKLLRDLQQTRGRFALMVLASAAGMFAFATMLSSSQIMQREIVTNYRATNPASATLTLDGIDAALLEAVRQRPGIAQAEAGASVGAVLHTASGAALPLKIFVVQDFEHMQIGTVYRGSGRWPPPPRTLLLEREALKLIDSELGASVVLVNAKGDKVSVTIGGTLHDPALPPATRGQTVYAYATPNTLAALGLDGTLRQLKITVSSQRYERAAIETKVASLALWLQAQGLKVQRISVPPPDQHPHWKIMSSVQGMLLLFSVLALVLSAVLNATVLGGMLAQQTRQIGIMKTIGARATQVTLMYLALVLAISAVAASIGTAAGLAAGRALTRYLLERMLNFTMHSDALPPASYLMLAVAGLLLPLLVAAVPIVLATRLTVHAAINRSGAGYQYYSAGGRLLERLPFASRTLLMALRNSMRRRARLTLTLALLSAGGAVFIGSLNVREAARQQLVAAADIRMHDMETTLSEAHDSARVERLIGAVPGVVRAEAWPRAAAAVGRSDGLAIEHTYPDGNHGTLALAAVPPATAMLKLPMKTGRWLNDDEEGVLVLNNAAALQFYPHAKAGDLLAIWVGGQTVQLRLTGVASENLTPPMAYVSAVTFAGMTGQAGTATTYRVIMERHDPALVAHLTGKIEAALAAAGIRTRLSVTEAMMRKDVDGHFDLMIAVLLSIAAVMALVGALGLSAAMGSSVAERSREFGIMRTIGATPSVILRNVLGEGTFVGLFSVPLAVLLSLPLAAVVGTFLGELLFGSSFPVVLHWKSVALWVALVLTGSVAASLIPARKAVSGSIHQAFSRV